MGLIHDPGSPVDCSGLTSACIVAGGESDPVKIKGEEGTGVTRTVNNTTEIDINKIQVGNLITFNNNGHIGIVSGGISYDSDGNVESFKVIQSASSTGPKEIKVQTDFSSKWKDGNDGYWSPKLGKAYKWDTKPDSDTKPKLALTGVGSVFSQIEFQAGIITATASVPARGPGTVPSRRSPEGNTATTSNYSPPTILIHQLYERNYIAPLPTSVPSRIE